MNMKDSAMVQVVSFFLLCSCLIQFGYSFLQTGVHLSNVSLLGSSYSELIGVVLFNFGLAATIPAWLHEKGDAVDPPTVIW